MITSVLTLFCFVLVNQLPSSTSDNVHMCDTVELTPHNKSISKCYGLPLSAQPCVQEFISWQRYSKNVINVVVNPEKNLEIVFQPKNIELMETLILKILIFQYTSADCTTKRHFFEVTFIFDFQNGKLCFFFKFFY